MKKGEKKIDEYMTGVYKNPKHMFYRTTNPNEYDDPLMKYNDIKNVLKYIDKVENVKNKREIRKCLDLLNDVLEKGAGEQVGRISDYGNIRTDLYKIASYLSEVKYNFGKSSITSLDMAKRYKESVLEKITMRERQLNGESKRFDWMNPNNFKGVNEFLKVAAIISFVVGLIFLSPNLTGNVIANLSIKKTSLVGVVLIILGLSFGFFWVKGNKKGKQK